MLILSGCGARHGQRLIRSDDTSHRLRRKHSFKDSNNSNHAGPLGRFRKDMEMNRTLPILLATTALAASPVLAQQGGTVDLGTIVLSPNLTPVDVARTGANVEVVDGRDLQGSDSSLIGALARVPGVSFSSNGGVGTNTNLRIRGLDNAYIGVRFDGIDVSDPSSTQTAFNFGGYASAGLGRVEILKGSQSAIYGSEAIAGVINITSWRPTANGFSGQGSFELGSFGTRAVGLSFGHKSDRGEVALSLSSMTSDGISARSWDAEEDSFEEKRVTFSARYQVTDNLTIGGNILWRDTELEIDRSAPSAWGPGDNSGENFGMQKGGRVFAEFATGMVKHTLSYSVFRTDRQDPGGFTTFFNGERKQLSYQANVELSGGIKLNFGLDKAEEDFQTTSNMGAYDTKSAVAELLLPVGSQADVSVTLRHDDHSLFGGHTSGRIAGVYRLNQQTSLRAVIGTGFRAPSLYELYSPYGNASLVPEESRNLELGVEHRFAGDAGVIKATLFYTEVDSLIDYVSGATGCASPWGCYVQVPGTTTSQGVELSGRYALSQAVAVYGNYTYTDAKNSSGALPRVPEHDFVLGVDAKLSPRLNGKAEVQHVAGVTPSIYAPAGHKVGDYTLVNLSLSYAINDKTKAYLRIENAFDEDYETAGGFNQPGRAMFFGISASF